MKHKTLDRIELKQLDDGAYTGEVSAVLATFNAVDHDGDVVVPGAFTDGQKIRISAYNHASWGPGALPVGRGEIRTTATEAQFTGQFFMATANGRDTFEVVKEMAELQEWSWGYDILEADQGTLDGQEVQFLRKVEVHEASPVLLGASIGSRTIGVKGKQLSSEITQRLRQAGVDRWGGSETYVYCCDYDLDEGYAVFNVYSQTSDRYLRVPFMRGADGAVALGSEETEVEPSTTFRPKSADEHAAIKARAAALTGAKLDELPDPAEGESIADYDARLEVEAVEKALAEPAGAKGAIASHSTATTDESWSASTARSRCPAESGPLRALHAWVDSEGDAAAKSSYKFPHHMVSDSGSVGAANLRACSSIIAILNGGRGGASIPDGDRRGVYNHAARHLRDGDQDVPELNSGDPGQTKLSDHLAWATAEVETVTDRLADVVASRSEKGKELGEASSEAAEALEARLKALREVLASAAENEQGADAWDEGLEIEDQLLRAH